jgi:nitroimidazol reductase NimA-like FMN-containing flavoprotein (pyridoxamine 5'-phosphate oxidase superfamily)
MPDDKTLTNMIKEYFNVLNMTGELNNNQIDEFLSSQILGRIGCCADGVSYVIPVNYVYFDNYIVAHSNMGLKIDIMRKNPDVCFEVDVIKNMVNWQCVILWGKFEEITDEKEQAEVLQKLVRRLLSFANEETSQPAHGVSAHAKAAFRKEAIWYKIKLTSKTGRFEMD